MSNIIDIFSARKKRQRLEQPTTGEALLISLSNDAASSAIDAKTIEVVRNKARRRIRNTADTF